MQGHQPHPATPISDAAFLVKRGKKRGSYNCGRCGVPKKGHKCLLTADEDVFSPVSTPAAMDSSASVSSTPSVARPARRRRALSFDDVSVAESLDEVEEEEDADLEGTGKLPGGCLWEVMRRLPPVGLLAAAGVCRGWRETARRLWRAAEELRLRVPAKAQIGFVGSVLQKCPGLVKLSLRIERLGFRLRGSRSEVLWSGSRDASSLR